MNINIKKINILQLALQQIHSRLNEKQFLMFASTVVGISAGIAAVLLKYFVHFIRYYVLEENFLHFNFKYLYLLFPLLGIGITILIVKKFFKGDSGDGNVGILHSIAKKGSFLPFHQMYSPIITGGITVGFGGSAGLESPIVSAGAAIGSNFSRISKLNYKERTLLLAAGTAGGIAGAFNSPIAGILFALEVILIDISISAFIPLLIAATSGALISKIILKENILLHFLLQQPFDYYNVPFYILLGLMAGVVSLYYVTVFRKIETLFHETRHKALGWAIGGISLAVLIIIFPSLFGEGYESIKLLADVKPHDLFKDSILMNVISNKWSVFVMITLTMLLKAFATGITLGSGGNGGSFAPSLFVGAYLGFAFAFLLQLCGVKNVPISNFTIVAMSGILSGVFHAPLTAIFLIAEITGGYELIIPLMIVSSISLIIVKYFHPVSMDLKKLKDKGTIISENKDTNILSHIDVDSLIESDSNVLNPNDTLRIIIQQIKHTKRNTLAVVVIVINLLG